MVELIKQGGNSLKLVVISVSQQEAEKFDSDSSSGNEYYDYSDKRLAPLSIPETRQITSGGETFLVRYFYSSTKFLGRAWIAQLLRSLLSDHKVLSLIPALLRFEKFSNKNVNSTP